MLSEPARIFLQEAQRHLEQDSYPKLEAAVRRLTESEVWWRPNQNCNSVGNLLLHLEGNVRQWIICGLGGARDTRRRPEEFAQREPLPITAMLKRLKGTVQEACEVLDRLQEADLLKTYKIQIYEVTGLAAILHVVEHFSHHTGQVLYVAKMLKDVDLAFYDL